MQPHARREQLLIQEMDEGLVVYDLRRHRAHHLNRTAALVWQSCDGHKAVSELTRQLQAELGPELTDDLVWQALDRLGKARLLRERLVAPAGKGGLTRRQLLRRVGLTAAALVPIIWSVVSPAPLRAQQLDCDQFPCVSACADACQTDADCPQGQLCRLRQCQTVQCFKCLQMRCAPAPTTGPIG
jgi:hypothetical protein